MRVSLLVPGPIGTISGGYGYDRAIVAGLRDAGHMVDVIELADVAADWAALPAETIPVIDGLALPLFAGHVACLAGRSCIGLIHHPAALETGHPHADRADARALETALMQHFARIVTTSEPTALRLASEFAVPAARIAVVVPGTDEAPRSLGSGVATCHILSVGTLIPRKGHDTLLRAVARLFDLDWHLTIAGSPARNPGHAAALVALADELGITARVTFAGEVADAAMQTMWQRADVFALATHFEGYGMAVAEALKRGVPVAVTAGGAAGALITSETGIVCPVGDHDQYSKALRRLIFDRDLRHDMSDAAYGFGRTLPGWPAQAMAFAAALLP